MVDRNVFVGLAQAAAVKLSQKNLLDIEWDQSELVWYNGRQYIPHAYILEFSSRRGENGKPIHKYQLWETGAPHVITVAMDDIHLVYSKGGKNAQSDI